MSAVGREQETPYQLEAQLPDWCALKWHHAVVCSVFVAVFLWLSYLPIPVAGVWHRIWSGGWILEHGIYSMDPTLPLAEGMRFIKTGWLTDVLIHWMYSVGGIRAISIGFAVVQTLTLVCWAALFVRRSGVVWTALLPVLAWFAFMPFCGVIQSFNFAALCFFGIVALIPWDKSRQTFSLCDAGIWNWLMISVLMALWANLDSSFIVGLVFFGAIAFGRLWDSIIGNSGPAPVVDREIGCRFVLFELMLLATLATPAGAELWKSLLWLPDNPVLNAMGGWNPTNLASWTGVGVAAIWACWIYCARYARTIPAWQVVVAVLATISVACCQSFVTWFATLMTLMIAGLARPRLSSNSIGVPSTAASNSQQRPLRFAFTLICGLLIWIGFSLSPISAPLHGGSERTEQQMLSSHSPVGVSGFLKKESPKGLVWMPSYWSDWLQVDQPSLTPVFSNSNAAVLPAIVHRDYQRVFRGESTWNTTLEKYAVTDLVVDKDRQKELTKQLRRNKHSWVRVYEDKQSIVYRLHANLANKGHKLTQSVNRSNGNGGSK